MSSSAKSRPQGLRARPVPRTAPAAVTAPAWPLENGERLTSSEFLRRYEADTLLKKAQLIEGIVHMPSPVRFAAHARPDGLIQLWLGIYALAHPELEVIPNATLLLDSENAPQPDAILCSAPQSGGRVWLNEKDYLCGSPELVCEVAASSASVDLHDKFRAYRRSGIAEYLVWLTQENRILWFRLEDEDYVEQPEQDGKLTSTVFPGLVLDVEALLAFDRQRLVASLRTAMAG